MSSTGPRPLIARARACDRTQMRRLKNRLLDPDKAQDLRSNLAVSFAISPPNAFCPGAPDSKSPFVWQQPSAGPLLLPPDQQNDDRADDLGEKVGAVPGSVEVN